MSLASANGNPLQSDDPRAFDRVVEAVGPASLLLVIDYRMDARLRTKLSAEDIWQEALLHAWRDRAQCKWAGLASFRRWLLGIIDHRIHDARDFFGAAKRNGEREQALVRREAGVTWSEEPMRSTTPSRMAAHREQAELMKRALADVPEDLRVVVRMRLFEGCTMPEIADELGLGLSSVKHRYRKAIGLYRPALMRNLGSEVQANRQEP